MKFRLAACSALGGLAGGTLALGLPEFNKKREKLAIKVTPPSFYMGGVNILPVYTTCLGILPTFLRERLILSMTAPRPALVPRDVLDLHGKQPHAIDEIKKGKVWRVSYERENHFLARWDTRQQLKLLGMDLSREETQWRIMQGAESWGRAASDQAHRDLQAAKENWEKGEKGEVEVVRENMVVVKLNTGGILLYSPVRIQENSDLWKWLEQQGKVEWVVLGSSEHTLQLPDVLAKFPSAKIVASTTAGRKLAWVGALPKDRLDFDYTKPPLLAEANKLLREEGVQLEYVQGDCVTHSLFLLAHGVLCEADLLYTHQDGEGFLTLPREKFRELRLEDSSLRLFKFGLLSKPTSPNGFLPPYRFWMMDPSLLWSLMLTPPNPDGSSSAEMANSLRRVLALPFDTAVGVHFDQMDAEAFRGGIDANWNWLDGKSLLPPPSTSDKI